MFNFLVLYFCRVCGVQLHDCFCFVMATVYERDFVSENMETINELGLNDLLIHVFSIILN